MKVLTVIGCLSMGGAEHMAYELIKNLDRNNFSPKLLCYGGRQNNALENSAEKICPVEFLNCSGHVGLRKIIKVMKFITAEKPDILHAHMGAVVFAIPWGILHHKPVVVTVHTKPEQAFSRNNEKLVKYGLRRGIVFLVAVSEDNYEKVQRYFHVDSHKCTFINNGIDTGRFYRKRHEGFAYINVARQDENKNQTMLLNAFKKVHDLDTDTKLYLIGDGPSHNQLIQKRRELGLDDCVEIPGNVDDPEKYYALSDVYVQTSHREAMPLSILEAMAAGLPIISTDVGGIKDVVDTNGFLVADGDEKSLVNRMREILLMQEDEQKQMVYRSFSIVNDYSSSKMALRYEALYKKVTGQ